MSLWKKIGFTVLAFVITLIMIFIPQADAAKKKVKISDTKISLYVGESYSLKLKNNKKKIKWSTSNKKVATVSSKGKVKGKKKGSATITAKVGKKKYKCKVTVKNEKVKYIKVIVTPTPEPKVTEAPPIIAPTNKNITPTQRPIPTYPYPPKTPVPIDE